MDHKVSIRDVNLHLRGFVDSCNSYSPMSLPENLALTRFRAKFEEPTTAAAAKRRTDAWERWIGCDGGLSLTGILGPHWAKARLLVREILSDFRMGPLTFTNGSSFEPLGDHLSIACKLSEKWTITDDCFELFAKYSYWHRALKHAVKKRFASYCSRKHLDVRSLNRRLWRRYRIYPDCAYRIYKFKLWCTVEFVHGNRWSTVPKNNLKDRSICLEPLCNMLVQRAVGLGIRECLRKHLGIDLDNLAEKHRSRISDPSVATIDLTDCSDTISLELIRYLLPKRVLNKVCTCRSEMTLGPDDNYYIVRKVSSMGNGFTFDLMSLVLTALTRSIDGSATVFGDDIICQNQYAETVLSSLKVAGFNVNLSKTNVNSNYRESCGAHFVDGHGYVTSFDIKWVTDHDSLVVTLNKVAILAIAYGGPFETLRSRIWSCVPPFLLGAAVPRQTVSTGRPPAYELDGFVRYGPLVQWTPVGRSVKVIRSRLLNDFQLKGKISFALSRVTKQLPPRRALPSSCWDLYFQYIHSGWCGRRIPKMVCKSTLVARIDEEQIGFI